MKKTHKDIDKMYTEEEYRQLYDVMPVSSTLKTRLKEFLDRGLIYFKKYRKPFIYRSISQYMSGFSVNTYDIVYRIPFNKLALYLNNMDPLVQAALKWRFIIGK
jgi:hypothetical protein